MVMYLWCMTIYFCIYRAVYNPCIMCVKLNLNYVPAISGATALSWEARERERDVNKSTAITKICVLAWGMKNFLTFLKIIFSSMLQWCNYLLKVHYCKAAVQQRVPMQLHGQESNRGKACGWLAGKRDNHLSMQHILHSYAIFNQNLCIPSVLIIFYNNLL
jgi:hypothetical protein